MTIGIYGGSFNPPHKGHEIIAKELVKQKLLDHVIFVPTGIFYPKKGLLSNEKRFEMLELICEENSFLSVSDYEFQNDLVYTYQTLDYFQKKYSDDSITLIVGSDNFKQFKTWKRYRYILATYPIIVILRDSDEEETLRLLTEKGNITFCHLSIFISSTKIREAIANKREYQSFLNTKVYQKIKENHYYEGD